jgi:5-methylcytosine-specific restriction endonuclease McrA
MSDGNSSPRQSVCRYCNRVFDLPDYRRRVYCSRACGVASATARDRLRSAERRRKKRSTPQGRAKHQASNRLRAERIKALTVGPRFTNKQVYERDGWICAKCGVTCTPYRDGFKSTAATIDHIIPICKDGPHSFENCRTMCWQCNSAQGGELWKECDFHQSRMDSYPSLTVEVLPPPENPPPPAPAPIRPRSKTNPDGTLVGDTCSQCGSYFEQDPKKSGWKKYCSYDCSRKAAKLAWRKSEAGRAYQKSRRKAWLKTEAGRESTRRCKRRQEARQREKAREARAALYATMVCSICGGQLPPDTGRSKMKTVCSMACYFRNYNARRPG